MSLAVVTTRSWTALPLARWRIVAALPRNRCRAIGQHSLAARVVHCQRWASQSAGQAADVQAADVPVGERERPERPVLPDHLQRIVDDYDQRRSREDDDFSKNFWLLGYMKETKYAGLVGMWLAGIFAYLASNMDDVTCSVHEVTAALLRRLEPETARRVFVGAASWGLTPKDYNKDDPYLITEPAALAGVRFITPVGFSSGFDREARAINAMFNLGFGFGEVGPVMSGSDEADSNVAAVRRRIQARDRSGQISSLGVLGLTIGGGRKALVEFIEEFGNSVQYFVVDLGLVPPSERDGEELRRLVAATVQAASDFGGDNSPPIFLRLPVEMTQACASTAACRSLAVAAATTADAGGAKGFILGGKHDVLQEMLADVYAATDGRLVLVADGVASGMQALECMEAGATLVQFSSLLLTDGPGACRRIKSELAAVLWKQHYTCLKEAIGAAHRHQRGGRKKKKNLWRPRT